jgi:hypothetical protein
MRDKANAQRLSQTARHIIPFVWKRFNLVLRSAKVRERVCVRGLAGCTAGTTLRTPLCLARKARVHFDRSIANETLMPFTCSCPQVQNLKFLALRISHTIHTLGRRNYSSSASAQEIVSEASWTYQQRVAVDAALYPWCNSSNTQKRFSNHTWNVHLMDDTTKRIDSTKMSFFEDGMTHASYSVCGGGSADDRIPGH